MEDKNLFIRLSKYFVSKDILKMANRTTTIVITILSMLALLTMVILPVYIWIFGHQHSMEFNIIYIVVFIIMVLWLIYRLFFRRPHLGQGTDKD